MFKRYPRIVAGGFESRTDERGQAVHAALLHANTTARQGVRHHGRLLSALDNLEAILAIGFNQQATGIAVCRVCETRVQDVWRGVCAKNKVADASAGECGEQ